MSLGAGPLAGQPPKSTPLTNAAPPSAPQPAHVLRLSAALQEADSYAFPNRVAQATAQSERARARLSFKALLPSARIETGVVRTTDPIAAFGTTLRQRRVTPEAFNPTLLNNPDAITNVQGGLVLEVPLLNVDAVAGMRGARAGADAAKAASDWTAINTRADVVRAYYGAVYATEAAMTLQQAGVAADAALHQVQAMVRQGLVTRADALQAEVRAADVASQLFAARDGALTANRQLGVLLGRSNGESILLPDALPTNVSVRAMAVHDTLVGGAENRVGVRADARAA
ncbi:MAG: TolC family protein, partial [Gemmatimonadaceae bacterium]